MVPKKGKVPGIKIFSRFHFSSALKRMSVVAGFAPQGAMETTYFAAVKGAPETLKHMVGTGAPMELPYLRLYKYPR